MEATVARSVSLPPIGRYWWLPLGAGILTILVGILALAYPGPTLLVVGLLLGIYLVLWGAVSTFRGVSGSEGMPPALRIVLIVVGLLALLAGLWLIVRPEESVPAVAWVIGFWWVATGVLQLIRGAVVPEGRGVTILLGVLGVTAGAIILAQPAIGLATLVVISGIGLIVQGGLETMAGWQLRRLHKEGLA
jgi:uncharacterized membrane protein HdeD (DUF308 family)